MSLRITAATLAVCMMALVAGCVRGAPASVSDDVRITDELVQGLRLRVAAEPRDADAALNLGIALAHRGALGEAVYHLETARLIAPRDRDIQDALALTHRQARMERADAMPNLTIVEGEPESMAWWRFFRGFGAGAWAWTLLAGSWLWGIAMLARRALVRQAPRDVALVAALLGAVAAAIGAGLWIGRWYTGTRIIPAVVVSDEPVYREAPDELSPRRRQPNLYEGVVALQVEARDGWRMLELADGARVWVDDATARPIYQPQVRPSEIVR